MRIAVELIAFDTYLGGIAFSEPVTPATVLSPLVIAAINSSIFPAVSVLALEPIVEASAPERVKQALQITTEVLGTAVHNVNPAADIITSYSVFGVGTVLENVALGLLLTETEVIIYGAYVELVSPAIDLFSFLSGGDVMLSASPAPEITRTTVALVSLLGANSASQSAVGGRTDWANINNSTGLHDTTVVAFEGNINGNRSHGGQIDLVYANYINKSALTITSVKLNFYVAVALSVLNNALVELSWSKGGAEILLETITGNVSSLITPRVFDITADISNWADLDALKVHVSAFAETFEIWTTSLDAVELEVIASSTILS